MCPSMMASQVEVSMFQIRRVQSREPERTWEGETVEMQRTVLRWPERVVFFSLVGLGVVSRSSQGRNFQLLLSTQGLHSFIHHQKKGQKERKV